MIKHRLEIDQVEKYGDEILRALKENQGGCDEIWLFLDRNLGLESMKQSIPAAKAFKKEAEKLGVRISVETNAFGHGHAKSDLRRYECEEFSEDIFGTVFYGQYCWNSEYYRKQKTEIVRLIASELQPATLYYDDDLRIVNWGGGLRCFCPLCVKKFNEREGTAYTREELADKVQNEPDFRKKYVEFSYDGIANFAYETAKAVAEASSVTHMGAEHGGYSGETFVRCIEAMYEATGKTVRSRSGAGTYSDIFPTGLTDKSYETQYQLAKLPSFVDERCNEIENYPSSYYSKTPYGTCLEGSIHLASGFNSVSMKCWRLSDFELFGEVLAEGKKRRKYWEEFSRRNRGGAVKSGLQIFVPENYWGGKKDWAVVPALYGRTYAPFGIPVTYAKTKGGAYYFDEAFAETVKKEELVALLSRPVATTGAAICALCERGFGDLLGFGAKFVPDNCYYEEFTNDEINEGFKGVLWGQTLFRKKTYRLEGVENARVLGVYRLISGALKGSGKDVDGAAASAIVTTAQGGKWFIAGYGSDDEAISWNRREQLNRAVREITGGLLAEQISRNRLELFPVETAEGKLSHVSVVANVIADQKGVTLLVRNPVSENAVVWDEYGCKTPVPMKKTAQGYEISVGEVNAWSIKTVFFE